jgi:putative ABC transport system substrate-binding protein
MTARRALFGAALAAPAIARAQAPRRARLGIANPEEELLRLDVFMPEMERLGWRRGANLELLRVGAGGDPARVAGEIAALVARQPDVIISANSRSHAALRDATESIPVITVAAVDPVLLGLSHSLARPTRNFTGNVGFVEELMGKRLELLREALPRARRIALLLDPRNPAFAPTHAAATAAAQRLGLELRIAGYSRSEEVLAALEAAMETDAVIASPDALALRHLPEIARRAEGARLPTLGFNEGDLARGFVFVLGPDRARLWRDAAGMVDRVLRGARVAELPFVRPTKVFMGVNLGVARRLGIEVPLAVLARAEQVIE